MVNFTPTDIEHQAMEARLREHDVELRYARELDRSQVPSITRTLHPDLEHLVDPDEVLREHTAETSGLPVAKALVSMCCAEDAALRPGAGDAFGSWLVDGFGTEEQKSLYGHLALAIAITEPEAGSDPAAMRSVAKFDAGSGEYVLNGEKCFISYFHRLDGIVVLVRDADATGERPIFATFVLPHGTPGLVGSPDVKKLGMRMHDVAGFAMEDVRLPASARLESDFKSVMQTFNKNRPMVAARALGVCRSLLDFTAEQIEKRTGEIRFTAAPLDRTAIEQKMVDLEGLWRAAWMSVTHVKWLEATAPQGYDYRAEASVAKALGGRAAREISQGCLEVLGPLGVSEEAFAEKWFRDVRVSDIYEGAGEIQRILIARAVFNISVR